MVLGQGELNDSVGVAGGMIWVLLPLPVPDRGSRVLCGSFSDEGESTGRDLDRAGRASRREKVSGRGSRDGCAGQFLELAIGRGGGGRGWRGGRGWSVSLLEVELEEVEESAGED